MKKLSKVLSDVASGAAGTGLYLLYMLFLVLSAFLPIYVVTCRYIPYEIVAYGITLVFVFWFSSRFPILGGTVSLILWIWGFILIITGQSFSGWRAILYYVLFVINMVRFAASFLGKPNEHT